MRGDDGIERSVASLAQGCSSSLALVPLGWTGPEMPGLLRAAAPRLLRASAAPRRALSTPAFCFDIDGVLKQGEHVLPQAKQVMQILAGNNPLGKKYPFICVTNGGPLPSPSLSSISLTFRGSPLVRRDTGGSLESERCKKLTKELEVEVSPVPNFPSSFRG